MTLKVHSNSSEETFTMLDSGSWSPVASELPPLMVERQWYLHKQIRPYCTEDLTCPKPSLSLDTTTNTTTKKTGGGHRAPAPPAKRRKCGKCGEIGHTRRSRSTNAATINATSQSSCSSGNCDVCGAWMRSKSGHTGAQVLSNRASHTTAPLLGYGSHRYRGPVTQLAQEHTSRGGDVSSQSSVDRILGRNFPSRPPQNGVGASNSQMCPPRRGAGVPETDPRPLRSFDELSISSLSISSCSVAASDLLRKAQERRDKFWTRHPNPPRT